MRTTVKQFLLFWLIFSLVLGQLLRIEPRPGIVLYPHDLLLLGLWVLVISEASARQSLMVRLRSLPSLIWLSLAWFFFMTMKIAWREGEFFPLIFLTRLSFYWSSLLLILVEIRRDSAKWLRFSYLLAAPLFAGLALIIYFCLPDSRFLSVLGWDDHYYRLIGTLLDPNFSGLILVGSWLAWWQAHFTIPIEQWAPSRYLTYLGGTSIMALALALTFSRASYLAGALAFGLLFIHFGRQLGQAYHEKMRSKFKPFLLLLTFPLVVGASLWLAPKPGGEGVNLFRTATWESRQDHDQAWVKNESGESVQSDDYSQPRKPVQPDNHARIANNFIVLAWVWGGWVGVGLILATLGVLLSQLYQRKPVLAFYTLALLAHAQFNASLSEPFVILLVGAQMVAALSLRADK